MLRVFPRPLPGLQLSPGAWGAGPQSQPFVLCFPGKAAGRARLWQRSLENRSLQASGQPVHRPGHGSSGPEVAPAPAAGTVDLSAGTQL